MKRITLFLLVALGNVTMYGADDASAATTPVPTIKKMAEELAEIQEKTRQAIASQSSTQKTANVQYRATELADQHEEHARNALQKGLDKAKEKQKEAETELQDAKTASLTTQATTGVRKALRWAKNKVTPNKTLVTRELARNNLLPAVEPTEKDAAKKKAGKSGDAWYETAYNDTAEWIENNPIYTAVGAGVGAAGLGSILAYRAASKYRHLSDAQFEEAMDNHSALYVGLAKFGRYILGVKDIRSPFATPQATPYAPA